MARNFSYPEKIFSGILLIIILALVFNSSPVLGANPNPRGALNIVANQAGIQTKNSLSYALGQVFQKILGIMGLILLVLFVIGGITWMTSEGNAEKLKKARGLLIHAIIGLIIVLVSYALVSFVTGELQEVVNTKGTTTTQSAPTDE